MQQLTHLLEPMPCLGHFATLVIVLLHFLECEPEVVCDFSQVLVDDMEAGGESHDCDMSKRGFFNLLWPWVSPWWTWCWHWGWGRDVLSWDVLLAFDVTAE